MIGDVLSQDMEALAKQVVDAIYCVHKELGPGLLESVYEEALCFELASRRLKVVRQHHVPIVYRGTELETDLRPDIIVNDCVIVEVKSVTKMEDVFEAQLFTYLKLTGIRLGFLVNFNVRLIRDGIDRIVR